MFKYELRAISSYSSMVEQNTVNIRIGVQFALGAYYA